MAKEPSLSALDPIGGLTSRPNPTGHLAGLPLQTPFAENSGSVAPKELYETYRTMAMTQAAQLITAATKKTNVYDLGDRIDVCAALALFDSAMDLDEKAASKDPVFLILYIHLSFSAENYPYIPYFNRLLDKAKAKSNLFESFQDLRRQIMRFTRESLSLARFTIDYKDRIQQGWEALAQILPKVSQSRQADTQDLCVEIQFCLSSYMGVMGPVTPPATKGGKCAIRLIATVPETDLYPMLYVVEHMPEQLRDIVDISCEPPKPEVRDVRDFLTEQPLYQNLRFALKESEGHNGVALAVYGRDLQKLDQDGLLRVKTAISATLVDLLGYYGRHFAIQSISVLRQGTPPLDAVSLMQLPQALQDLGYSLNITLADLKHILHRTYTGTSSGGTALRTDILTGETTCYQLHAEYLAGRTEAADHLIFMGVTPCFLAWPKSIIPDDEKAFCHRLLDYLEAHEASPLYQVLGTASGSQYFYLDLLSWSIDNFIKDVEAYFATVPGGDQVLLQGFRHGSRPGPATLERLQRFDDAKGVEDPPDKARIPGPQGPVKKKGKNKKKRKK